MTDETFENCLKIVQRHSDFLKEHRDDGLLEKVFTKEEIDERVSNYEKRITEGYKLLNKTKK